MQKGGNGSTVRPVLIQGSGLSNAQPGCTSLREGARNERRAKMSIFVRRL